MAEPDGSTGPYDHQDAQVAALAARQHVVMHVDQLVAVGLSANAVYLRVRRGRLHRVHPNVFSLVPPTVLTREGRWLAAVLACGPGAALSHRSAAALHDLRPTDRAGIDVAVPRTTGRSVEGIDVHRSRTLTAADITVVNAIPCTTVARTQVDLADVVARRGVERAWERAEQLEVFDLRAVQAQAARNAHRRGAPIVRGLLADYGGGQAPTESELEERLLEMVRAAGLPAPQRQAYLLVGDPEGAVRADFVWHDARLVLETDGDAFHRTRAAFERDRRRDQRLTAAGWRVVRVTWAQLRDEPERIVALLEALLRPG